MQKVRKSMGNSQKYPLLKIVHVDGVTVGGKEKEKHGRGYDSMKKDYYIE